MWQRVQTLFIAISTALITVMLLGDVATIIGENGEKLSVAYMDKLPYLVLLSIGGAASLVALFSFKHRMFQLRIVAVGLVLMLGLQGWLAYDYFKAPDEMIFNYSAIFPLVCAVMDTLAIRGIFADELMVRSSSRLRSAKRR